ncbi:MAG: isopentenyl-diphosphate Delta-isomerase, partial [Crocinitomicaceae bacterium]
MHQNLVVLVNELDQDLGVMEKLEAHQKGLLHRAFSVLIFNSNNELLLQRRAFGKYHSEGLWTNTCCSHPYPGETILSAGKRRLKEEMG